MKKLLTVFLISVFLAECCFALSVRESVFQNKKSIEIANEYVSLTFLPEIGGRCLSFKDLKSGVEFIKPHYWGLFADHWGSFVWPSGLMHLPYTAKVEKKSDSVSITLSVTVPEYGGGAGAVSPERSLKIKTSKDLVGLVLTKTITLKAGSPLIYVHQTLKNPTKESKSASLGFQHHFDAGKSGFKVCNLPDVEGLIGPVMGKGLRRMSGKNWSREPVAGWTSCYDTTDRQGLVFLFNYNQIDKIYSSGWTAEWFLEPVTLAPGKSFETDYSFCVIRNMDYVVYAGNNLAASAAFHQKKNSVDAEFSFRALDLKKQTLKMRCDVYSGTQKKIISSKSFEKEVSGSGMATVKLNVPVTDPSVNNHTVFRWTITRKNGTKDYFEYNYIGNASEYRRRFEHGQIGSGAAALAGGGVANAYKAYRPKKIYNREKIDYAAVRAKVGPADRVLVLFGLYTNFLRIHEALSPKFGDSKMSWANGLPDGIQGFPGTIEDLFRNKLVVMSNINFKALRDQKLFMLDDYVRAGGTLLICGGFYTYGHGEFQESIFEDIVPFEQMRPFEIERAEKGSPFHLKKTGAAHPLSGAIQIDSNDEVMYLHDLKVKKDAVVLATAGKYPAIVVRNHGKGRVIACTMTVMGKAASPWYDGQWWKNFLGELVK